MSTTPDPRAVLADPNWLAHRYDERADAIQFIRLGRDGHRAATFITDEHLPADLPRCAIARHYAVDLAPPPAPVHFVFHSAFCCSTLVAAALDVEGHATTLKEPVILNDIVGFRRRGAQPRDVAERLDHALRLLARPFAAGEAVVIKPSNIFNGLIPLALTMRPDARALLLHAPLPLFLASVAKKGLDGRLWVRKLMLGFIRDGLIGRFGFSESDLFGQSDLQIAALGWVAQQAIFHDVASAFGPDRVIRLDSETLLDDPVTSLHQIAQIMNIDHGSDSRFADHVETTMGRDSKTGTPFSRTQRNSDYQSAQDQHADELAKVIVWADHVAKAADI